MGEYIYRSHGEPLANEHGEIYLAQARHGMLTVEQVLDAIFNGSSYASYDGVKYYASGIDMQTITDTLNAHIERTCQNEHGRCSVCGAIMYDAPHYCPNCGAKIIENRGL